MRKEKENSSDNPYQYSLKQNLEDAGCSDEWYNNLWNSGTKAKKKNNCSFSLAIEKAC